MADTPDIASFAAALGEAARARMLLALMDGRALTATELAVEGGVAPSTASSHLARLAASGLVVPARQGRHRYFRLAGREIASVLEGLMSAAGNALRTRRLGPRDEGLRYARVCYDHLAGALGSAILDRLFALRYARRDLVGRAVTFSGMGERFLEHLDPSHR